MQFFCFWISRWGKRKRGGFGLSRDCFGLVNCTLLEGWFSLSKLSSLKLRRRCAADEFLNLLWLWAWWRFLFSILRTVTTNIMDFNFQSWRPMPPPPSSFSKKEMLMKHSTSIIIPANCHVCTATLNIIFIFFFHKKDSWNLKDLDDCYHNWGTLCKKKTLRC